MKRRGFTLAELLLVIAMIAVLTVTTVNVLLSAQEESRLSATQALITKIDNLLDQRKAHYDVRPIPIKLTNYSTDPNTLITLRRMILMDIVRAEMPVDGTKVVSLVIPSYPSREFRNAVRRFENNGTLVFNVGTRLELIQELRQRRNFPALASRFARGEQPGEYLYGIVASTDMNAGSGLDLMGNSAFGNVDNDGFFELVDAWGDPLTLEILDPSGTPMNIGVPFDIYNLTFRVRSVNIN